MYHSKFEGRSKKFPITGSFFGPGGRGKWAKGLRGRLRYKYRMVVKEMKLARRSNEIM